MANDPVISPTGGIADGSVTPAKISTTASDTFVFPNNVEVDGGGNGDPYGGKIIIKGATGLNTISLLSLNGNLYFYNESTSQYLAHFDVGSGVFAMNSYALSLANQAISNVSTLGVGIADPSSASAIAEFASTAKGILPPRMTTTQKDAIASPAEGLVIYDLSLHALCVYNGSAWKTVTVS